MQNTNLSPEFQKKLVAFEQKKPEWQTLHAIKDVAAISQEMLYVLDSVKQDNSDASKNLGVLLTDAREQLMALNDKMSTDLSKEAQDTVSPVVEAITKLEKAIAGIDTKPQVNLPAPIVNVGSPDVSVTTPKIDTSEIEKLLKVTIPSAFREAIGAIPVSSDAELIAKLDELSGQLADIDRGVRMKPEQPNIVKVTNPDGTSIIQEVSLTERYDIQGTIVYTGEAAIGSSESSSVWTLYKYDLTTVTAAFGKIVLSKKWSDHLTETYA